MRIRTESGDVKTEEIKEVKIGERGKKNPFYEIWFVLKDGSQIKAFTEYDKFNAVRVANFYKPNSFSAV